MALSFEITSNNKGAVEGFKQVSESAKQTQREVSSSFQKVEDEIASASRKVGDAVKKTTEQIRQQIDVTEARIDELSRRIESKNAQIARLKDLNRVLNENRADPLRIGVNENDIKRAESELDTLKSQLKGAVEESVKLGEMLNSSGSVENFTRLSTQISQAKTEMAKLAAEGKQNTEEYAALVQKVNDLSEAAKKVNLDTTNGAGFKAFAEGVNAASGGLTAITGALSLFNVNSETAAQVQAKLQSVMSISLGIQQLMSLTYQDSAVRLKALALWKKMVAAATGEEAAANTSAAASAGALAAGEVSATGATITLTGAIKALGVAIKSIPVAGWIIAIAGTVVSMVGSIVDSFDKVEKKQKELEKRTREAARHQKEVVADSVASQVTKYEDLRKKWNELKTTQEKNQFINDNANAFNDLRLSINNVDDAEDVFVEQTADVVEAIKLRAQASAAYNLYLEAYEKKLRNDINGSVANGRYYRRYKVGAEVSGEDEKAFLRGKYNPTGRDGHVDEYAKAAFSSNLILLTQEAADALNAHNLEEAKKIKAKDTENVQKLEDLYTEYDVKAREAEKKVKQFSTASNSSTGLSRGGSGGGDEGDDAAERLRREREDAERLAELRASQAIKDARDAKDQELARWQAEIDVMDEGLDKKIAQIKLNYAKEREALGREREDLIADRREAAKELWEAENAEAVRNGETWESSGAAANSVANLNEDDIAYFSAKYSAIDKQTETATRDLFNNLIKQYQDYTAERLAIEKKFNDDIADLMEGRRMAEEKGDTEDVNRFNSAISTAIKNRDTKLQSMSAQKWAEDNGLDAFFGDLNGQSRKALRAMRKRLNTRVGEEGVGTEEKSDLNKRAKKIDNALRAGKIDTAQYISQQAGEAKDLVGKLEEQGIFGKGDAGKRIGAAFDAAASAGEAYAKFMQGDFVGALSSGLDAVLDLFTVFGIGEGNMAELQEEIDHLTGATQDLTQAFSKIKEDLDESNTLTARENYEKAKANVMQREQNMRQTMSDRLRQWERGSRSLGAKVNGNSSAQSALAQMGLSSIYDLTSLSPERIQQLATDYAGGAWTMLMAALKDANSEHNGDAEAFMEELTQYAGLTKELEELTDELQEKVTGISFEGFKGNFVSMLQDLSKDIDDFAADTEDQFNKISVQRIADNYEGELRALYDDWAEAAEDGLTEAERRSLEARKADIAQRALDERQAAIASGLISTSAERKAGSTKGFGSMNSEQADELNGRFTALQVSNQGILNSVVQSAASLAAMSGSFSASAETLQSLQMLAVARNSHLEDISAFCKNISARVDAIEGYSKTTSEKL